MLVDSGLAEVVLVATPSARLASRSWGGLLGHAAYRLARATIWRTAALARVPAAGRLDRVPRTRVALEPAGDGRNRLAPSGLQHIRDAGLDVLLRVGLDGLTGEVVGAARQGVWSIHHGEPTRDRGGLVGFWELHDGSAEIRVVLERHLERLDAGEILLRAVLAVEPHSLRRTIERAYRAGVDLPLQACRDLLAGRSLVSEPSPTGARASGLPDAAAVGRVIAATVTAGIRRQVYGTVVLKQWSIGRLDGGPAQVLTGRLKDARWVRPNGRTRLLADPMIVPGSDGRVVLCEALDYADGRGVISRITVADDDAGAPPTRPLVVRRQTVVDIAGLHLSYPAVVHGDEGLVVMPEAAASGGLVTARLDPDATSVSDVMLAPGLAAIDPSVFRHGDRWWLACTEAGPTSGSHLWLFHAPAPRGPWTAHARNPVVIDARSARGAGLPFMSSGALYRPTQDLRAGYGRAIRVMRILTLTPDAYDEQLAVEIRPDPAGPFPRGLHTVSVDGDAIWIDGYRNVVHPLAGWFRLRTRSRRRRPADLRSVGGWLD